MIRLTLVLITCSFFGGCMTQADQALWAEAKQTLGGKGEVVAEAPSAPEESAEAPKAELKTSKDDAEKAKNKEAAR